MTEHTPLLSLSPELPKQYTFTPTETNFITNLVNESNASLNTSTLNIQRHIIEEGTPDEAAAITRETRSMRMLCHAIAHHPTEPTILNLFQKTMEWITQHDQGKPHRTTKEDYSLPPPHHLASFEDNFYIYHGNLYGNHWNHPTTISHLIPTASYRFLTVLTDNVSPFFTSAFFIGKDAEFVRADLAYLLVRQMRHPINGIHIQQQYEAVQKGEETDDRLTQMFTNPYIPAMIDLTEEYGSNGMPVDWLITLVTKKN